MTESSLYIVATPIGNLADITLRALDTLKSVDLIAAEDTRHTRVLLNQYQITTPTTSLHGDNEKSKSELLIDKLKSGISIALVSDAGTPLISDPGAYLVQQVREAGFCVVTIPGPCALVAAVSIAGLPTQTLHFEGFLPHKGRARRSRLERLVAAEETLIFYESCHRIESFIKLAMEVFGEQRRAVIARELTKQYETVLNAPLVNLLGCLEKDENQRKGEFVILIEGIDTADKVLESIQPDTVVRVLAANLPTKQASKLASTITGIPQREIYQKLIDKKG